MNLRYGLLWFVRAFSHAIHYFACKCRLIYYNLSVFIFFKALPWSTVIYGQIRVLHRPVRLIVGENCRLGDGVYFATSLQSTIKIGKGVTINSGCVFVSMSSIEIGENTAIAEYVTIRDQAHNFSVLEGVRGTGYKISPVRIGSNVWIGRGVYIGEGVVIGDGCVVGANSVVHGVFPSGCLIAGAPAKIKKYF